MYVSLIFYTKFSTFLPIYRQEIKFYGEVNFLKPRVILPQSLWAAATGGLTLHAGLREGRRHRFTRSSEVKCNNFAARAKRKAIRNLGSHFEKRPEGERSDAGVAV